MTAFLSLLRVLILIAIHAISTQACTCYTATSRVPARICPDVACRPTSGFPSSCPVTSTVTRPAVACKTVTTSTCPPCDGCVTYYKSVTGCYTKTTTLYPPCPTVVATVTKKNGMTTYEPCPTPKCIVQSIITTTVAPSSVCGCKKTPTVTSTYSCPTACNYACATTTITKTVTGF